MNASAEEQHDQAAKHCRSIIDVVEESRGTGRSGAPSGAIAEWDITLYVYAPDDVTEVRELFKRLEKMEQRAKLLLLVVENATDNALLKHNIMQFWRTDEAIIQRMGAGGGGKRDYCGKKSSKMKDGELLQCSRCKASL